LRLGGVPPRGDDFMLVRLPRTRLCSWRETLAFGDRMSIQNAWEIKNDGVARWVLGDNAATGTARLLVLALVYIVVSVLILSWLLR
jgi:hypothetical protein